MATGVSDPMLQRPGSGSSKTRIRVRHSVSPENLRYPGKVEYGSTVKSQILNEFLFTLFCSNKKQGQDVRNQRNMQRERL